MICLEDLAQVVPGEDRPSAHAPAWNQVVYETSGPSGRRDP